jgi:hypothetical protein
MHATRMEAVATGQRLLDAGCIYHVCFDHHEFKDDYLFFLFASNPAEAFPKVWIGALPHDIHVSHRH